MSLKRISLATENKIGPFEEESITSQKISYPQLFDVDIYFHQLREANKTLFEINDSSSKKITIQEEPLLYTYKNEVFDVRVEPKFKELSSDNSAILPQVHASKELYEQIPNTSSYATFSKEPSSNEQINVLGAIAPQTSLEENLFQESLSSVNSITYGMRPSLESKMFSYTPWHFKEPPRPSNSYYSTTSQRMPTLRYYQR